MAEKVIETPETYNLKGKVKSLVEINSTQEDTLLLLNFNASGFSTLVKQPDYSKTYSYSEGQLRSTTGVRTTYPYDTVVSVFNSKGFLIEEVARYKRQSENGETIISYSYDGDGKRIEAKYSYSFDRDRWDVVDRDEYIISLDEKGRVSQIKIKNFHKEYTYGATHSYNYDSLGRITSVGFIDKDAGSNSALSLWLSIYYNDEDNSMTENLNDNTVRNSLWSYGYTKYEQYNENGDVIASDFRNDDEQRMSRIIIPDKKQELPPFEPKFDYEYDAHGNWITKYLVQNNNRFKVSTRVIQYYE